MSSFRFSFYRAIVLVCLLMMILGHSTHGQTAVSTSGLLGATGSSELNSDSTPANPPVASGTNEPSGSPWIERIPAWQVVGTVLLVAFAVLLLGVIWLRWIMPGGR